VPAKVLPMKTITVKQRIQNFEGYTYKPGTYEIVEGQPVGWQVTEEMAQKLQIAYPALVTAQDKKAGK